MDNPTVVILTDPTTCQIGQAEILLKALLQLQQINTEGVSASQAFCDHPAAAMQFIDAYEKAFPDLREQSSGLPSPEQLYSIVADGRFGPLPASAPFVTEAAKDADARSPYPLYVLSLGVPEALMQALQHNSLAKSKIRVLEIAPVQQPKAEAISVAEAVAPEPVAAWLTDTSSTRHENGDDILLAGALSTEGPLKLASVEVNLDQVQIERRERDYDQDQNDPPPQAPIVVNLAPAGTAPVNSGAAPQTQTTELAGGETMVESAPPAAPVTASPPLFEPVKPSSTEPGTVLPPGPSDALPPANPSTGTLADVPPPDLSTTGETPSGSADDQPADANNEGKASASLPDPDPDSDADSLTKVAADSFDGPESDHQNNFGIDLKADALTDVPPEEPEATAGTDGDPPTVLDAENEDAAVASEPAADEETSSSAKAPAIVEPDEVEQQVSVTSDHPANESSVGPCSFTEPGDDVLYPAAGSFAGGEDLTYVAPLDLLFEASILHGVLHSSEWTDVVDLNALHDELAGAREAAMVKPFDVMHIPPAADWPVTDGHSASPSSEDSALPNVEPRSDEAAPHDPGLPALHDDL